MAGNLPYRNLIFIPVFFAFYILFKSFEDPILTLMSFEGRPVSAATAEAIDIGARVALFYKALFFVSFLLIALTKLTLVIQRFVPREEMILMNGLSLAGFCLLVFRVFGAEMRPSLHVIFALLGMISIGSIFHRVKKEDDLNYRTAFLWSALMATALFFLQWQLLKFTSIKWFASLPLTILTAGTLLYLLSTNKFRLTYPVFKATFPFVLIPILTFVSMELMMILNQHSVFISQRTIFIIGFVLILLYSFYARKKFRGIHSGVSHDIILFRNWIPWMLAGMFCFAFYSPTVKVDVDIFENANNILPLHQWFNFGKVPLLESFNAHAIADFGTGLFYSILNGNDPMGYFVYRFLVQVLVLIMVYFLIYKISGDGFLALWMTLAYPYIDQLIPSYFNLVPLTILAFIRVYEKQTTGRYAVFFLSLVFMVLWRVDLGLSVLIAGFLSLIMLVFFVPGFETNRRALTRGLIYSLGVVLVIFVGAWMHSGSQLFTAMKDVLAYISSSQSYGLKDLATQYDIQYYSLYFFLPSVIFLIAATTIYNVRVAHFTGQTVITSLVIIFLCVFYFTNFQRGLIRHSLYEQWNAALTSYGFFIIAAFVLMLIHKLQAESKFFIFFIVSTLLVANYVYREPNLKTNNNYFQVGEKVFASAFPHRLSGVVKRIAEEKDVSVHSELKNWLDENFPKGTFLDFSNSPMLYYYTNRVVPSYFLQIPHTAHNEYLQNRFIEDLKKYDVPAVVFSNVPFNFWDNLDGVPNAIRHYRIAEYIYREYKPAFYLSKHTVWIRKSSNMQPRKALLTLTQSDFTGEPEIKPYNMLNQARRSVEYTIKQHLPFEEKKYAIVNFHAVGQGELKLYYRTNYHPNDSNRSYSIDLFNGENNHLVLFGDLEKGEVVTYMKLQINSQMEVRLNQMTFYTGKYLADDFSTQVLTYSLKWIPSVWGNYYKQVQKEMIKVESELLTGSKSLDAEREYKLEFTPLQNKEYGNSVQLTAKSQANQSPTIVLSYGEGNKTNGTFTFNIKNDSTFSNYYIRVSSQYNWYSNNNSWISLKPSTPVEINSAVILRGD